MMEIADRLLYSLLRSVRLTSSIFAHIVRDVDWRLRKMKNRGYEPSTLNEINMKQNDTDYDTKRNNCGSSFMSVETYGADRTQLKGKRRCSANYKKFVPR